MARDNFVRNSKRPAQPFCEINSMVNGIPTGYQNHKGLTKREMFAMHAMQAVVTGLTSQEDTIDLLHGGVAEEAVQLADALLKELEQ